MIRWVLEHPGQPGQRQPSRGEGGPATGRSRWRRDHEHFYFFAAAHKNIYPPEAQQSCKMHSTMDTDRSQSVGAVVTPECNLELPTWLSAPDPKPPARSKPMRELVLMQYESVFPRILEKMYGGSTLQAAIGDDFREIDSGAFLRWIKKDPQRQVLYKEAK